MKNFFSNGIFISTFFYHHLSHTHIYIKHRHASANDAKKILNNFHKAKKNTYAYKYASRRFLSSSKH